MVSIQEMLLGDVKEETEEKIDIEHGFPHLTYLLIVMPINGLFSVMQINELLIRLKDNRST
jgi:hypothetical protein